MRKLILTTVSVLALSLAAGGAYAQQPAGSAPQPATQPQTGMSTTAPDTSNPQGDSSAMGNQPQGENQPAGMQDQSQGTTANMSKTQVRQLQERLRAEGLYKGRIDGILGPKTREAMEQSHRKSGALSDNPVGEGSSTPPAGPQENNGAQGGQSGLGTGGAGTTYQQK